jgi:hypothetical protein
MQTDELAAALAARRELGPDYDAAFADAIAARIGDAVDQALGARTRGSRPQDRAPESVPVRRGERDEEAHGERVMRVWIAAITMVASIPITAVVLAQTHDNIIALWWIVVAVINVAYGFRRRR